MTSDERMKLIGERIAEARKLRRISGKELSAMIGVSQSRLSNWENGNYLVGADFIYAISKSLAVTSDFLLGLTEDPTPSNMRIVAYGVDLTGLPPEELDAIKEQVTMRRLMLEQKKKKSGPQ